MLRGVSGRICGFEFLWLDKGTGPENPKGPSGPEGPDGPAGADAELGGPRALSVPMTRATCFPACVPGARALSGRFTSKTLRGKDFVTVAMLAGLADTGRRRTNSFSEELEELLEVSRSFDGTEYRSSVRWLTQSCEQT